MCQGLAIRRTAGGKRGFTRGALGALRDENCCGVPRPHDLLEHQWVRLPRERALPPHVEPPPQHLALSLRTLQALNEHVALAAALFEFGIQPPAAGQTRHEITNELPQPGHLKAIIASP